MLSKRYSELLEEAGIGKRFNPAGTGWDYTLMDEDIVRLMDLMVERCLDVIIEREPGTKMVLSEATHDLMADIKKEFGWYEED